MCKIESAAGLLIVVILAVVDIRKREIPLWVLAVLTLSACGYRFFYRPYAAWQYIGGVLMGMTFFGVSFVTRQAIGYGDSWMIMILGVYLGLWNAAMLLMGALLLAAAFSAGILGRQYFFAGGDDKKSGQRKTVPFIPMLAVAYIGVTLL